MEASGNKGEQAMRTTRNKAEARKWACNKSLHTNYRVLVVGSRSAVTQSLVDYGTVEIYPGFHGLSPNDVVYGAYLSGRPMPLTDMEKARNRRVCEGA